ncbi:MAG: TolC family protein [Prolixibacteraceae bacterium]|nr:TolC family protein [Prolixibacteraceae bacterium]
MKKIALMCFVLFFGIQGTKAQETPQLLTLENALEFAENNSPNIIQSKLGIERQLKQLEARMAQLKSNFSLQVEPGSFSRRRTFSDELNRWYTSESFSSGANLRVTQPILITDGTLSLNNSFSWQSNSSDLNTNGGQEIFQNRLSITYDQPLFTYNRQKMDIKQLELNLENANLNYAMQRLNLERSVTQQFYSVYIQQKNLEIDQAELENTQKNYELIKSKADAGLVALEELYQAELNLMQSKSAVESSVVSYESAKEQFKLLIGMDIDSDFTILNVEIAEQQEVNVDLDKAIESGLLRRIEIRQREIDLQNSEFSMIQVKAQNEFAGDLSLNLGITGDNKELGKIFDKENRVNSPSISLSFNVPLYDWGEKKARIEAEEISMQLVKMDYEEIEKEIIISIRDAYRSVKNQWSQIAIAEQSLKNAELTYKISEERYQNGQLSGMDMNLQQNQLSSSQISFVQAQINYKMELLGLKIETLYDFEKNVPVVLTELYIDED